MGKAAEEIVRKLFEDFLSKEVKVLWNVWLITMHHVSISTLAILAAMTVYDVTGSNSTEAQLPGQCCQAIPGNKCDAQNACCEGLLCYNGRCMETPCTPLGRTCNFPTGKCCEHGIGENMGAACKAVNPTAPQAICVQCPKILQRCDPNLTPDFLGTCCGQLQCRPFGVGHICLPWTDYIRWRQHNMIVRWIQQIKENNILYHFQLSRFTSEMLIKSCQ